jgi:hypothetical protein
MDFGQTDCSIPLRMGINIPKKRWQMSFNIMTTFDRLRGSLLHDRDVWLCWRTAVTKHLEPELERGRNYSFQAINQQTSV